MNCEEEKVEAGWEPIATAPKDGTVILARYADWGVGFRVRWEASLTGRSGCWKLLDHSGNAQPREWRPCKEPDSADADSGNKRS